MAKFTKEENLTIDCFVTQLIDHRQKNSTTDYGYVTKLVTQLHKLGIPGVTHNVLTGRAHRQQACAASQVPDNCNAAAAAVRNTINDNLTAANKESHNNQNTTETNCDIAMSKSQGRPKGTTQKAKREKVELKQKIMNEITIEYKAKLDENKLSGKTTRLSPGTLENLVATKRLTYNLDKEMKINLKTIKSRLFKKGRSLTPEHCGAISPLKVIEQIAVETACQMAKL